MKDAQSLPIDERSPKPKKVFRKSWLQPIVFFPELKGKRINWKARPGKLPEGCHSPSYGGRRASEQRVTLAHRQGHHHRHYRGSQGGAGKGSE